jgi:hypothetical protein
MNRFVLGMALCLAAASAQENRRITKQELSADVPKEASPENEITIQPRINQGTLG